MSVADNADYVSVLLVTSTSTKRKEKMRVTFKNVSRAQLVKIALNAVRSLESDSPSYELSIDVDGDSGYSDLGRFVGSDDVEILK